MKKISNLLLVSLCMITFFSSTAHAFLGIGKFSKWGQCSQTEAQTEWKKCLFEINKKKNQLLFNFSTEKKKNNTWIELGRGDIQTISFGHRADAPVSGLSEGISALASKPNTLYLTTTKGPFAISFSKPQTCLNAKTKIEKMFEGIAITEKTAPVAEAVPVTSQSALEKMETPTPAVTTPEKTSP